MARKFNGFLQYLALFVLVFIIARLFFAGIFGVIFPSGTLTEGPVSPYYGVSHSDETEIPTADEIAEKPEFSKLISVYEKISAEEKMKLYGMFSSKLTEEEIDKLFKMASDGVDDTERDYFNSLAAERLTAQEIGELYAIYEKYA